MTGNDRRLWLDLMAARYLAALENEDFAEQDRIWDAALDDPELEAALHATHDIALAEDDAQAVSAIAESLEATIPSATVRETAAPVTFADVANELFRHPPLGLSNDDFRFNDELRSCSEPLPTELGLSALIDYAKTKFGSAPREYWRAFRLVALEVRMRANSQTTDYQLAARRESKPGDRP